MIKIAFIANNLDDGPGGMDARKAHHFLLS
jgi:hypothetical protein